MNLRSPKMEIVERQLLDLYQRAKIPHGRQELSWLMENSFSKEELSCDDLSQEKVERLFLQSRFAPYLRSQNQRFRPSVNEGLDG